MVLPFGSGAHDKGKWLRSGLEHSTAGNSSFFALNLIFQLHGCPAYCLCPAPSILGLQTRDKHCHCVVHQGNGEALTTIDFQSQGKKMLVHQFCLLLYIILYLLPTADNDFLTYPVWLVEVKSSKNTYFILLMSAVVFLSWKSTRPLSLITAFLRLSFSFYNPSIPTSPNSVQK